ncbi:MAG: hypothetical protein OXQ29_14980 [Rhodospirillaceae bacterium]|nr:hypothetical protein [Rhodospirillaceae bacterium]
MPSEHEPGHTIEIYVHSDGGHGPDLVEVPSDGRVADLVSEDESLWLEDANEALPADSSLPEAGIARRSHVHRGRCPTVKAQVRYAGTEIVEECSPATRVIQVFRWATSPKCFKLAESQIPKHGLALPGGDELLDPGTHVGSLVAGTRCFVTIDTLREEPRHAHRVLRRPRSPLPDRQHPLPRTGVQQTLGHL